MLRSTPESPVYFQLTQGFYGYFLAVLDGHNLFNLDVGWMMSEFSRLDLRHCSKLLGRSPSVFIECWIGGPEPTLHKGFSQACDFASGQSRVLINLAD